MGTADLLAPPAVMVMAQAETVDLLARPVVTVTVLVIAHLQPQQTEKVTLPPLPEKGLMEKVTVLALPEKGITETKEINVHLRHPLVRWLLLVRWLPLVRWRPLVRWLP